MRLEYIKMRRLKVQVTFPYNNHLRIERFHNDHLMMERAATGLEMLPTLQTETPVTLELEKPTQVEPTVAAVKPEVKKKQRN